MKITQIIAIILLFATLSFSAEENKSILGGKIDAFLESWYDKNADFTLGGRFGFDVAKKGFATGVIGGITFYEHVGVVPDLNFIYAPKANLYLSFNVPLLIQFWHFNLEAGGASNIKFLGSDEPDKQYEYGPMLGFGYNFSKNSSVNIRGFYDMEGNKDIYNIFRNKSIVKIELNCRYIFLMKDLDSYDTEAERKAKAAKKAKAKK